MNRPRAHQSTAEQLVPLLTKEVEQLRAERDLARLNADMGDEMIVRLRAEVKRLEIELADMGAIAISIASGGAT